MKVNQLLNSNEVLALDEVLGGIKVSAKYKDLEVSVEW